MNETALQPQHSGERQSSHIHNYNLLATCSVSSLLATPSNCQQYQLLSTQCQETHQKQEESLPPLWELGSVVWPFVKLLEDFAVGDDEISLKKNTESNQDCRPYSPQPGHLQKTDKWTKGSWKRMVWMFKHDRFLIYILEIYFKKQIMLNTKNAKL